jgi:hypothetical protein
LLRDFQREEQREKLRCDSTASQFQRVGKGSHSFFTVIPAKAGIQCLFNVHKDAGFPLSRE